MFNGFFYSLISLFQELSEYQPYVAQYDIYFDFLAAAYQYAITRAVVFLIVYILGSTGIYVLSKNNSLDKAWFSFVPFLRYVQLGRLVGAMRVFGGVTKNLGVFVAVFAFVSFVAVEIYDVYAYYEPCRQMAIANKYFKPEVTISPATIVLSLTGSVTGVVSSILNIFLTFTFFRLYERKHPILYSIIGLLFNLSGIFIFVVRKNKKLDYSSVYERFNFRGGFGGDRGPTVNRYGDYDSQPPRGGQGAVPPQKDVFEEYSDAPSDKKTTEGGNDYNDLFN